jgi:hypothetical protein
MGTSPGAPFLFTLPNEAGRANALKAQGSDYANRGDTTSQILPEYILFAG